MKKIFLFLLFLISTQCLADYEQDMAALQKGMPSSVSKYIDRQVMCNHWSGEPVGESGDIGYDEHRRQEVISALKDLKCDALESDEKRLVRKYKNRPAILKSIKDAKEYII